MKREKMKTRIIGLILVGVVAMVSLGIYVIHKRQEQDKKQIIINETNEFAHNKDVNLNITVQKN
ncbi:hypothetical protein [uncultured Clostridium sp.]|uniref:hypothetical protein n=1 Tax=uncultured Clostridium sp. TaxID=59620 RepID=UPI002605ABB9|nr:hypothetical protein [uncultured Clostridium sp.]